MVSRMMLRKLVEMKEQFTVVGEASDGQEAIEKIPNQEVDIVLMDLMMPVMDGLDATRWLMENNPTPILLVSDLVGRDAELNFRAVDAGALDVVRKPSADDIEDPRVISRFHRLIRVLSNVPLITRRPKAASSTVPDAPGGVGLDEETSAGDTAVGPISMVVIGASTGGPTALASLLQGLDGPPDWPLVIVQHITRDFAPGMTKWLRHISELDVHLIRERTALKSGSVYVAPDSADLVINSGRLDLINDDKAQRKRSYPSIDVTLKSVANSSVASETLAILLTGMGSDGASALKAVRERGGWTVAQDRESSAVWGIPRVADELGAARQVLSLDAIGELLKSVPGTGRFDSR